MEIITIEREAGNGKWADAMTIYIKGKPPHIKTNFNPHISAEMRFKFMGKYLLINGVEHKDGQTIIRTGEKDGA